MSKANEAHERPASIEAEGEENGWDGWSRRAVKHMQTAQIIYAYYIMHMLYLHYSHFNAHSKSMAQNGAKEVYATHEAQRKSVRNACSKVMEADDEIIWSRIAKRQQLIRTIELYSPKIIPNKRRGKNWRNGRHQWIKKNDFRAAERVNGTFGRGIASLAEPLQQKNDESTITTYSFFICVATKPFSASLRAAAIHVIRGPKSVLIKWKSAPEQSDIAADVLRHGFGRFFCKMSRPRQKSAIQIYPNLVVFYGGIQNSTGTTVFLKKLEVVTPRQLSLKETEESDI